MVDRRSLLAISLAGAAVHSLAPVLAADRSRLTAPFPSGFLWGAATAAYQVEGNNVNSDVWALEHMEPTSFAEVSGDAANSFALWRVDLELVKALGLNTYRFSLEWSRIEPAPGQFSVAMLDHYRAMIAGCRALGLVPVVTFNHFTTPIWFASQGGWANPEAPALFARYCRRAAEHLAEHIGHALTLNEPNLVGMLEVALPGGRGERLIVADRAMAAAAARLYGVPLFLSGNPVYVPDRVAVQTHLLAGHAAGREAIKAVRPDLAVGVSLAMSDDHAAEGGSEMRDTIRAQLYDPWLQAARGDDFLGVQNYYRAIWGAGGKLPAPEGAVLNAGGAEIYPSSLANAVRYAHSRCPQPIFVTEHGTDVTDDAQRAWLIPAALRELQAVLAEGIPLLGYIHWSLIDNFEWFQGYKPHYGLCSVDRTTFARTPRPSAGVLGAIARANAV
ncbi:family 1 glycosylhydrolase [Croceibacterium ferulae]|uniref:family 1 glycosylhydrolase n=1 Tax=Croceibacterium ferulae TaxID=1854641 RepID=UPI000EAD82F2|nr:family 1 glycosylhydrolase [Croceibacterium ferulae]